MTDAHDRRRSRQAPDARTIEDLLAAQEVDSTAVEGAHATDATHDRTFLPPPRPRTKRHPEPRREPESTLSKVAKLAGLTTAASLLIGAVVASSALSRQQPAEIRAASPAPPQITGAAALGGFLPGAADVPPSSEHTSRSTSRSTTPSSSSRTPAAQTQRDDTPTSTAQSTGSTTTTTVTDGQKVAMVEQFYRSMVSSNPADALALLAPDLVGDEPGDLLRAWGSMSEVDVNDVQVQPDGSVRAVVTMVRHDGVRLRVTQVLSVATKDSGTIITRALLLSAQQL